MSLILAWIPAEAGAQSLRTVPSDHWAYSIADQLLLRHPELGKGIYLGARPWRQSDFQRIVERARESELEGRHVGDWVGLLEEEFVMDTVRYGDGTVSIHNEVSAVAQGVASKDDASFEPAFRPPEFEEDLGDPPARGMLQHDFAVQYDDRFALGWRYAADTNVRNDPTRFRQRSVRRDSEAGFAILDAYGTFHWGPVWVTAGRNELELGPGRASSIFISDSIPPIDHLRLELGGEIARFTGIVGRLSSDPQNRSFLEDGRVDEGSEPPETGRQEVDRLLYLHRVDWQALPWLQVAVSEAALATGIDRGLEFRYANLLVPFFVTQQDEDDEDGVNTNIFVNVEGVITAPGGFRAWGDVFVQEFFIDEDKREEIGNQMAFRVGGEWAGALAVPGLNVGAEYSRVDVFTYLHRGLNTNWTQFGVPVGSMMGPDADQGSAWVTWWATPTLRFTADALARRGGERSIDSLESTIGAGNPDFPSGTVQREVRAGLEVWGLLPEWGLEGSARVSYADVNNIANEMDAESSDERFWRAVVGLRWRWSFQ